MSGLTWLHVSDWHQSGNHPGSSREKNDRKMMKERLMEDIARRTDIDASLKQVDFIVFSGDVSYHAHPEEFEQSVEDFFNPLIEATDLGRRGWERLYIVPGNHDINWKAAKKLPRAARTLDTRDGVNQFLDNEEMRKTLLSPLSDFSAFIKRNVSPGPQDFCDEPSYFSVRRLETNARRHEKDRKSVAVLGLNTAWMSARNWVKRDSVNDYGFLALGEPQVRDALERAKGAQVKIAIMHHPFSWLSDFDRALVEEDLSRECHFILNGHTHLPRVHVIGGTIGEAVNIPAGAIFSHRFEPDPRYVNAYNFVHLDFESNKGTVYLRRWVEPRKKWDEDFGQGTDGQYAFALPKSVGSNENDFITNEMVSKVKRLASLKWCDSYEVRIKHTLEVHKGVRLVRHDSRHLLHMHEGKPEPFKIRSFISTRMDTLFKKHGIDLRPYKANHLKVNGKKIPPREIEDGEVMYEVPLGEGKAVIDYSHTLYMKPEDVYTVQNGRYAKRFRLVLKTAEPHITYEFSKLGGIAANVKRVKANQHVVETEPGEMSYPEQGYLIHWYPPE